MEEEIKKTTLEDWDNYLHNNLKIPERFGIVDKENRDKSYLKYFIVLGILAIAVILYLGYGDKFKSETICGNANLTCENSCPACPSISIPKCSDCSCNLNCGNTTINPVIYTNST